MSELLNFNDLNSITWQKLESHYSDRLEQLRRTLENPQDHAASEKLRGRIFEIRQLLALAKNNDAGQNPPSP